MYNEIQDFEWPSTLSERTEDTMLVISSGDSILLDLQEVLTNRQGRDRHCDITAVPAAVRRDIPILSGSGGGTDRAYCTGYVPQLRI